MHQPTDLTVQIFLLEKVVEVVTEVVEIITTPTENSLYYQGFPRIGGRSGRYFYFRNEIFVKGSMVV